MPALAGLPGAFNGLRRYQCGGRGGPDYYTDVPAGPIAIKNVADLYVYPNGLRAVKISGATVLEWLERSASAFRRIDAQRNDPQPLLDETFAAYNFDVFDGVTYAIDVTRAACTTIMTAPLVAPGLASHRRSAGSTASALDLPRSRFSS